MMRVRAVVSLVLILLSVLILAAAVSVALRPDAEPLERVLGLVLGGAIAAGAFLAGSKIRG